MLRLHSPVHNTFCGNVCCSALQPRVFLEISGANLVVLVVFFCSFLASLGLLRIKNGQRFASVKAPRLALEIVAR